MNTQQEHHEPVFKGIWIPASIWEADLSVFDKIVWAQISALGRPDKPCWASNEWLGKRLRADPETVRHSITKQRKLGLIVDVGFDGRKRFILAVEPSQADWPKSATLPGQIRPPCQVEPSQAENPAIKGKSKAEDKDENKEGIALASPPPAQQVIKTTSRNRPHKEKTPPNPNVAVLIHGWFEAYPETHAGEKYHVEPKDGAVAKRFLADNGDDPAELVAVARRAWAVAQNGRSTWWCNNQSHSLAKFLAGFNEIKAELRSCPGQVAPRAAGPVDYLEGVPEHLLQPWQKEARAAKLTAAMTTP